MVKCKKKSFATRKKAVKMKKTNRCYSAFASAFSSAIFALTLSTVYSEVD
jgi:hypothetical protein